MLKDARTRLTISGEALDLVGIRFWTKRQTDIAPLVARQRRRDDPARARPAATRPKPQRSNIPLVLSGHTHGGQVVLPVVGACRGAEISGRRRHRPRERTTMFVSRGMGTIYVPVRVNCPPEVAILTLSRA